MFQNYLKTAFRNLIKHKVYSFICIFGLSVGLACCILILLFIRDELSFDKFHESADRIYRVTYEFDWEDRIDPYAKSQAPLAPALLQEFPEISQAVRFAQRINEQIGFKQKQFLESGLMLADPSIFEVFTFPLLRGDPETALKDPHSIVLTEKIAKKYFGDEDPIGQVMNLGDETVKDYEVTGILEDIPSNSQLRFDFLISFENQKGNIGWGAYNYTTYVKLAPGADPLALEDRFPAFLAKFRGKEIVDRDKLHLQPLTHIHLHSNLRNDLATNRQLSHVYYFAGIALLILILACINFINLVTARSVEREKEVGLRKVVGAARSQLVKQFLSESLLQAFLAFLLALVLVEFFLPVFNEITRKELDFWIFDDLGLSALLIGLMLVVGILAGSYPSFLISGFQPASIFRKNLGNKALSQALSLRNFLVVVQFTISVIFLFSTFIMHIQMTFIRSKNLGYDKEHMIVLPIYFRDVQPNYQPFKAELLRDPQVLSASATSFLPSDHGYRQNTWWEGLAADDTSYMMSWIAVDHDFVETLKLKITQGRDFSQEYLTDAKGAYLLNKAAVQMIGWENPLGKQFEIVERGPVVGVVDDFHFQSLHTELKPMALHIYPKGFRYLLVRISANDISKSIQTLSREWQKFFPERLFAYSFFDEDFDRIYKSEAHLLKTSNYITGLAILIACLGLFGLASFTAARRTKEIGIRKVLGAGVYRIVSLLSQDFVRLVLVGILIAYPFSYVISSRWLQNFAYRVRIDIWTFLLVAVLVLLTSLVTVIYQAVKAATTDPVKTLRHE